MAAFARSLIFLVLIGAAGFVAFIYSGLYPMGADDEHTALVFWTLDTLRQRSVARAASAIDVPELDDPALLLSGGPDYNEMCSDCHLKPGETESDLSLGLYPAPPNFTAEQNDADHNDPGQQFWTIKHGIKASGMPAWGATHDDDRIWAMVAFLQRLPDLSPLQYQILTARGDDDPDHHAD